MSNPLDGIVSLTIEPTSQTIYDDSYAQFIAIGHFDDGSSRPLATPWVFFTSDDPSIATVNDSLTIYGRYYGVAPGTTTVNAYAGAGSPSATATLTVEAHPAYVAPEGRFNLGFGSPTLDPYPAWTRIDDHPNLVTSYTIDRGRSYELDQTDTGRASVAIIDPDGILDPTNPDGPYHGEIRPLLHAVLCRQDPVSGDWEERFRGFVEDYSYEVDPSQKVNRLTISLVDTFELLSSAEMQPDQFGEEVDGQSYYPPATADQRIVQILTDLGLPRRFWALLPGSPILHSALYSGGETPLAGIQEAADGEFPAVANVFCDRHGRVCFHGRSSRFDPAGAAAAAGPELWDYHEWKAGDGAAVAASLSDTAQVRALGYQRGVSKLINSAVALPVGAPDEVVSSQRVTDLVSVNTYGIRSWSATNLLTLVGDPEEDFPTSALTETKRFATFYVANFAEPRDRITAVSFRSLDPHDERAPANWQLLSKVDIGDSVDLTVAIPGGGGFSSEAFFVEGVHEEARALSPDYDDVTLSLDLSPRSYFDTNPWDTPLSDVDDNPDPPEVTEANPVLRSGHPKPTGHARDHEHTGPDPMRMHYEDVGGAGSGGGGGIQFDTTPQAGEFLQVTANDWMNLETEGSGALNIDANGTGDINLYAAGGSVNIAPDSGLVVDAHGDNGIVLEVTGDGDLVLHVHAGTNALKIIGLPTSDPGGGAVWLSGGALRIG